MLCSHVLKPVSGLKSGSLINYVKQWIAIDVYNINIDSMVEFSIIIPQYKLETARRLAMHLTVVAVLCKLLNSSLVSIMA